MPVSKINGVNINWRVIGDRGPWVAMTTGGRRGHDEFIPLAEKIDVKQVTAVDATTAISRKQLKEDVISLFTDDSEIALFYFAGHGHVEDAGGYLVTSDCTDGDDGLSLEEVLGFANDSKAKNKILILDSCYSGVAGTPKSLGDKALLSEGMTILTASSKDQYAQEANGSGVFTSLLVDALNGGAANLLGDITPGSIYAHIDQSLGAWEQRPIFKTNVKAFTSLRKVAPPIQLSDLKQISIPRQSRGFYCLSASKALVTREPPEGGYNSNFIWS